MARCWRGLAARSWAFVAVLAGFTAALGVAVANVVARHGVRLDSFDGLAVIDHATGWFALVQMILP